MEQIMNQTDVKVSFYLKKSEADAKGNCPVMARLIVGKYSETAFSVKLRVPQSLWLSGRACGKSAAARDITYIIHSGFISGYQNRYGDNLKPPTNVYHRMTA